MPTPRLIEHAGLLEELTQPPSFLEPRDSADDSGRYCCSFCGVGDSVQFETETQRTSLIPAGEAMLRIESPEGKREYPASVTVDGIVTVKLDGQVPVGPIVSGRLSWEGGSRDVVGRVVIDDGAPGTNSLQLTAAAGVTQQTRISAALPTAACLKLRISLGQQQSVFPIHVDPSVLLSSSSNPKRQRGPQASPRPDESQPALEHRSAVRYAEAIHKFADLLLEHRPPHGRTLIYACGQIDYFTIFAFQEVFRLLGIRNLAGNAEHCLNAGAVHNEILTGQEGPFLTIEQAINGPNRFYLLNGWNGLITHPPVFGQLMKRKDFDGYLVEVVQTETARAFVKKCREDRLLLIRSGTDPHLALSVAHELLKQHPQAVDQRFVERFADRASFENYCKLAASEQFDPTATAARIAPEPQLAERLHRGIQDIASRIARPDVVPINLPSVGLSQTKGAVAHCLWGSLLGLVGKYGLRPDGTPAGGTLRVPGQINAQTEVQGLSRRCFMGRVPMSDEGVRDATRRMGLPPDAYQMAFKDTARAALDYSDPADVPELFVCFGTQFESNMLGRRRWIDKLSAGNTKLVVVDPIPDPFTLRNAELVIPSPPHSAAAKLYQNGEWRLSLSVPRRQQAPETRTDATIVYDVMAEISRRLRVEPSVREQHPDLAQHSSYLRERFESPEDGGGLRRSNGEVSRRQLWERIQDYMTGPADGLGPLYCRPEHSDGRPITWDELMSAGELIYGGVGSTRYVLDYERPGHTPFRDIWRRPGKFRFFLPTEQDLRIAEGIILNSGRSTLSDDNKRVRFAIATFNSGKATSGVDLPDENFLYVSESLAEELNISAGDSVRVTGVESGGSIVLRAQPTSRVRGQSVYVSFHKTRAEIERGLYLNDVTSHLGRCPYTAQSNFKLTRVMLERVP